MSLTDYNNALAGKVSTSDYTTALAGKVSAGDFTTALSNKASTTDLTSGLALKVAKTGDTVSGPLIVQAPNDMTQAVQLAQLTGGVARPFRLFYNVSTTPVVADGATASASEIRNPFPAVQVLAIRAIVIKTVVAPLAATTITLLDSTGKTVFSRLVALASLPVVGNAIDLIGGLNSALPADIPLPVTLSATASAGKFEILMDGLLKKPTA